MTITNQLINGLKRIESTNLDLPLVPLNGKKQPLGDDWQNRPFKASQLIEAIASGGVTVPIKGKTKKIQLQGFGLLTGRPISINSETYYLMAVDQDGPSVINKINELSGGKGLPTTVAFTSGRTGRCQYLYLVPEQFKDAIRTKKIKAGTGEDGKPELLELRWSNLQSVLPPSVHPITGQYHWLENCAIDEVSIEIAPDWIISQMSITHTSPTTTPLVGDVNPQATTNGDKVSVKPTIEITVPVPAQVPLLQCCRKEVRDWVASGVPEGSGRNDTAINVGLELIGVERYLQTIGQSYTDSALSLFHEFCVRSGMTATEESERYQWCQKTNSRPSCPPDAIESCIKGWYWREVIKPQQRQHQANSPRTKRETGGLNQQTSSKTKINLLDAVKKILTNVPQDSLRHIALMNLSAQTGYSYRDLELLARTIERESNLDEETAEAIASLGTNLNLHSSRLDITKYLESNFAGLMVDAANAIPTAPEYLFNTLLSAVASCGGTSSRIVANPSGGYVQPLIMWTGNIAHSGQAKTPPQQIIIQPLLDLEEEALEKYQLELREYEQDKSGDFAAPTRNRYVLSDTTLQTKIRLHGENKRGFLEYVDELASDYRRHNQFKKGQGDDKEQELSLFNGGHISYDRSDSRLFLKRTAISKTGSLQWDTLAKLMTDSGFIESGYMARFLLCTIGDAPPRLLNLLEENHGVQNLQKSLRCLYEQMGQLPEVDYLLDYEAKVLFQAWNHTLVDATRRESNFGFSLVYAKIESYTLRLALWLHLVNSLLRGETPHLIVNGQTMKDAIEIASFYLGQQKLIWAHNDPHNNLEGMLLKIHTNALDYYQQTNKGVCASWAKQKFNALKKIATDKIRLQYFQVLACSGYGELTGEGKSMRYIPYQSRLVINGLNQSPKIGENSGLGENLVETPRSQMPLASLFQKKVGEIDAQTYRSIYETLDDLNNDDQGDISNGSNEPIEEHQFTNKSTSNQEPSSNGSLGDDPQTPHQPPNLETPHTLGDIEWLMKLLDDLESDPNVHDQDEWLEIIAVAEEKIRGIDDFSQLYPHYWEQIWAALHHTSPKEKLESAPTLDELKSLLLTSCTWVQLKQLHKQHPQQASLAYTAMEPSQQTQIDAIAATEVNQEVYKYVGPQRELDGVKLEPGTLVYLDPQSSNKNRPHLKVRLLQGLNTSWQKVVEISRDALMLVEKAVNDGLDAMEGHQGNLLDGLT